MYGETDVIRRRVAELREQGGDLRALADRLVSRAERVRWSGRAADALAVRVRERAGCLRAVAAGHDTAADSLEAHLLAVEERKAAIADAERRARGVDDAAAPPPGHRDWLTVDLMRHRRPPW